MFKKYFLKLFFGDRLTVKVPRTSTVYTLSDVIVRQVTGQLFNNLCKNIVKKLIWKFIDIFLNQFSMS